MYVCVYLWKISQKIDGRFWTEFFRLKNEFHSAMAAAKISLQKKATFIENMQNS